MCAPTREVRTFPGMTGQPTACSRPVRLQRTVVDRSTGEVWSTEFDKACGTRLEADCPHCSAIYRRDALSILQAGVNDADGKERPVTFLTLTAPGAEVFGKIHQRRIDSTSKRVRKCECGEIHDKEDPILGTPVFPGSYRYDLAADFNASASRLLAVTMQKLSRVMGRPIKWVRVAEFQKRGLVHFHVIVQGVVTDRAFRSVVRGGVNLKTGRKISPTTHNGWSWGPQCDIQRVLPGGKRRVGYYLVKLLGYAVKATGASVESQTKHATRMEEAALRSCSCEHGWRCRAGSRIIPGTSTTYQSQSLKRTCRRHTLARRGWGYRGHVFTVSRRWGMTFKEVRGRRRKFAERTDLVSDLLSDPGLEVVWSVLRPDKT